jgi:hypothetical protein
VARATPFDGTRRSPQRYNNVEGHYAARGLKGAYIIDRSLLERFGGSMQRRVSAGLLAAALVLLAILPVLAGTTGGLRGRITDRATGHGVPGVRVTLSSPSQSASATTDANGTFVLVSLSPDTYTVSVEPEGYDATAQSGINVAADQVQTISLAIVKTIATIGHTSSRSASNIVKPGTTSDVYSVNAAGQQAAAALGGPGGLNQAYSAFASVPGVSLQQGQQGWNQLVYVRGGDYEDVATELDGIPVQRASDVAPITTLSSLGQQELQIYTGGAPASADASGLSGYVNQVIRTGTYPGFKDIQVGFGAPAFYHKLQAEIGGATRNRNFSYYVGIAGINQDYRYGDQFNAGGNPAFFAPLSVPSHNDLGVYDGSGPFVAAPGQSYSIANTNDREFVGNFHFGIPHRNGDGTDDIQLLYANARILAQFYGSVNDLGGNSYVSNALGFSPGYVDTYVYGGALLSPLSGNEAVTPYLFPGAGNHPFGAQLPADLREISDNTFSLIKLQYQRNINDRSYFRLYGYGDYSSWFINGPVSANLDYGGEIADYEVPDHTYGVNARYENQITRKHLLSATASYQTQNIQTYSNSSNGGQITTNLVDGSGNCYSPVTGNYAGCYTPIYNANGTINAVSNPAKGIYNAGGLNSYGAFGAPLPGFPGSALIPTTLPNSGLPASPPAGSPAELANGGKGANWVVTNTGYEGEFDTVRPFFAAFSLSDQFRPTDKLVLNAGIRYESFVYRLPDTASPARDFWFNAWNRENCYTPGQPAPTPRTIDPATGVPAKCPAGSVSLVNTSPTSVQYPAFSPRAGLTYTVDPDTVLRASYGRYAQQPGTSYQQYNVLQADSPSYISTFLPYGFTSPYHQTSPSYSNSYDFSLEKHFKGTDYSLKLTPFYRSTQNELQTIPIGAQGVVDGLNTGTGRSYGVEFQFSKGDFARQGLSWQLAYTFTRALTRFGDFLTGNNFIDNQNISIKQYNAFTSFCAKNPADARCAGSTPNGVAAAACYTPAGAGSDALPDLGATSSTACGAGEFANPYWNAPVQPLLDRTAEYSPYDILPSNPFSGAVGFNTPTTITGVVNWRRGKLTLTPSATYTSGTVYGSPLSWPGYDPTTCGAVGTGSEPNTQTCTGALLQPDVYTGTFDKQGALREPTRFTLNFQTAYEFNPNTRAVLTLTSLIDHCYQRGYAWDNPTTCVYAQLPSNHLAPVGNFVDPSSAPAQLRYPYGSFYNNVQTGFVGQRLPFSAFLNLELRL